MFKLGLDEGDEGDRMHALGRLYEPREGLDVLLVLLQVLEVAFAFFERRGHHSERGRCAGPGLALTFDFGKHV